MKLEEYKDIHLRGEKVAVILGNGPSLRKDLPLLMTSPKGDYVTFGTNGIVENEWGFVPDYYVAVNPLVKERWAKEIEALKTTKFLDIPTTPEIGWSDEPPFWEGHTVTYVCLQLAKYMGCAEALLIGLDHDYGEVNAPNAEVTADGPDLHHFREDYFSDGARWNLPDLAMSEIAYSFADRNFYVQNCSSYSKLDIFARGDLEDWLTERDLPLVSAIVSAYKCDPAVMLGCLEDLYAQTVESLEVIVVAQWGSEEERVTADYMYNTGMNINVVLTEDVPTVYHAWNLGIQNASGLYVTNANTDDRHHPKAYEIMSNVLAANYRLDLVYHDSYITWEENQDYDHFVQENQGKELVQGRHNGQPGVFLWPDYSLRRLREQCIIGPQPMWRRRLHQKHGYFNGSLTSAGDFDFWLRVAKEDNMFHIPRPLGLYTARLDGIELSDLKKSGEETRDILTLHASRDVRLLPQGGAVRVAVGSEYAYIDKDEFKFLVGKM